MLDHFINIHCKGSALAPDKGHAERLARAQGLFHLRHKLKRNIIGGQQGPEAPVMVLKRPAQQTGLCLGLFFIQAK
jgi:hypothetical protein